MSINVLAALKEHLSGDVVSNLASLVGESSTKTDSAITAAVSSLLGGLIKQSGDNQLLGNLFGMLTSGEHDGGLLSNLGALSRGGDETNQLISQGGKLLSSLFGDKVGGIANAIASASGVSGNTSSSLLSFIAPLVMSMLGKALKTENIGSAVGLASFLSGQSGFIKDVLPSGVDSVLSTADAAGLAETVMNKIESAADSLGFDEAKEFISEKAADVSNTFENLGDKIEDMAEETLSSAKEMADDFGDTASKFGSHVVQESKEFAHSAANVIDEAEEKGGKFLPWLLILAALALIWGLLKSCGSQEPAEQATESTATPPAATAPPVVTPPPAAPATPAPEPAKVDPVPPPSPEPAADTGAYEK
ncbi:MAG: DUF937 domain-containing protein [Gammaproteobacteria bacterium]|nr:DUF937 domain-containing protein [Gammaproteobacteria bacterium]